MPDGDGPVVVIDVLRAFSVVPLVLDRGAERVVLVEQPEDALRLKERSPGSMAITDGPARPGFDVPNSPPC